MGGVLDSMLRELSSAPSRFHTEIEKTFDEIHHLASSAAQDPGAARILTERLALLAATAELYRLGLDSLADAFAATRLSGRWRSTYGMIDSECAENALKTVFP